MIINVGQGGGGALQEKTATPSTSQQVIKPDGQYYGLEKVTIEAAPLEVATVKSSTTQQTITPSSPNIGFSSITVQPNPLQTKSVTLPTSQPIRPDSGYYGLAGVNVSAPLYSYSAVTPTSSVQTLSIPSGYYGLNQVTINAAKETGWYKYLNVGRNISFSITNPGIDEIAICLIMSQETALQSNDIRCLQIVRNQFWKGVSGDGTFINTASFSGGSVVVNGSTISITLPLYSGTQLYFNQNFIITFSGNAIP